MLKEIQAYPVQTAEVGLALQQRAIGVRMKKLALFRPRNIHLKSQRAQILFAPCGHQYPLFYSMPDITAGQTTGAGLKKKLRIWLKR